MKLPSSLRYILAVLATGPLSRERCVEVAREEITANGLRRPTTLATLQALHTLEGMGYVKTTGRGRYNRLSVQLTATGRRALGRSEVIADVTVGDRVTVRTVPDGIRRGRRVDDRRPARKRHL